jgi:hypothetical protein
MSKSPDKSKRRLTNAEKTRIADEKYKKHKELATKCDALVDAIKSLIKTEQLNANTYYHYLPTPKGNATLTIESGNYLDPPRVMLFWLLAEKRGAGRAALEIICKLADKHQAPLGLEAIPLSSVQKNDSTGKDLRLTQEQLEKFYKSFGFKEIGKKDKYAIMLRMPIESKVESKLRIYATLATKITECRK